MLPALPSAAAWSHVSATLKQRGALMLHRAADWHARVLGFLAVAIVACSSDDSVNVPSQSGFLEITTTTTGTEIDPDGYAVQVDAQDGGTVGSSATMQIDVPPGDHTVQLTGLAPNCSVSGENPRQVSVTTGATATVDFAVTCSASSGSSWTAMTSGTIKDLLYVSGSSATNVFAAGENVDCSTDHCGEASILQYDGTRWSNQYTHSGGVL